MAIEISGTCPLLQVFDMPTSLAFYCDVLGFEITGQSGPAPDCDWVLLNRKGTELMLNTAYEREHRPALADPARVAAHGDTILYFGWEDLDRLYADLRTKGIRLGPPGVAHYGMKQLYLQDADGYGLCFQWPVAQAAYDQWVASYGLEPKTL